MDKTIQLIGFQKHEIAHTKNTLLGFAGFLLPDSVVIPNPNAPKGYGPTIGIHHYDDGVWVVNFSVRKDNATGEIHVEAPSRQGHDDDMHWYDIILFDTSVRQLLDRLVREALSSNEPVTPAQKKKTEEEIQHLRRLQVAKKLQLTEDKLLAWIDENHPTAGAAQAVGHILHELQGHINELMEAK